MLAPFVLPEGLGSAGIALPVGAHVGYEVLLAGGIQDVCDVFVGSTVVTAGFVCAIAVVWPESVDGPAV